ncbi:hypothetical protein GCM10010276_87250 [Streptomyces longisporus]|uniref:Uncharacterized protein n=1 Tax=Streptomyces longisporus TaxID=1948 RepID=A0ABP6ASY9_STRLO
MATRISVSVKGLFGLDEPERLLDELAARTRLSWHQQEVDQEKNLGGIVEIVLIAVVTKTADMTVEAAVQAVKDVIGRWREERLDPPEASIRTDPEPQSDDGATDAEGLDG